MIIEFYDEEEEKECTMMAFEDRADQPPQEQIAKVTVATLGAVNTMLESMTPLRLVIENTKTGETRPLKNFDPRMVVLEEG
jgi:type VI protein secretion system component VasF